MHFFGWICLSENAPLIGQRIAMRNIKPFSLRWNPTEELAKDFRFVNYGLAPKSAADFAFF
jgi:hypothetical protein